MPQRVSPTTVIASRFNGPPGIGNGGYVASQLAQRVTARTGSDTVEVTLRRPTPLDTPLAWRDAENVELLDPDGEVIAVGAPGALVYDAPAPVSAAEATAARDAYAGFDVHIFATCLVCGTERADGDGMRVFSGPVSSGRVACTWTPHEAFGDATGHLGLAFAWAALDCPGAWAAAMTIDRPFLLGRMTARVARRPRIGEECVVMGEVRRVDGRKHFAGTALYDASGELLGQAEQTWFTM